MEVVNNLLNKNFHELEEKISKIFFTRLHNNKFVKAYQQDMNTYKEVKSKFNEIMKVQEV